MTTDRFFPRMKDWHPPALTPDYKGSILRAPKNPPILVPGKMPDIHAPVFNHSKLGELDNNLITNYAIGGQMPIGSRLLIHGRVLDENANPVPDCLIEIWQANSGGRYRHKADSYLAALDPNFGGYGRTLTKADGSYEFLTIRPGAYPFPNGPNDWRPAHIHFSLFGNAFEQRLVTQMYFEGDPLIQLCPIIATLPSEEAVDRLTAKHDPLATVPMDMQAYQFDLVLRGRGQTSFENRPEGM
ncbi:MAG: protocatechuate 3,4-dioxygenase subunit beta [Pseudomonadota bacterium]